MTLPISPDAGEFERISKNLLNLATELEKVSTLTAIGLGSIFVGIGATLILNDLGQDVAVRFLKDYAASLEQGHANMIERPN